MKFTLRLSLVIFSSLSLAGSAEWLSTRSVYFSIQDKVVIRGGESGQIHENYFGFTDPSMELLYGEVFFCGESCFGMTCLELSPAEIRLRQHRFKPGEKWIGSSRY